MLNLYATLKSTGCFLSVVRQQAVPDLLVQFNRLKQCTEIAFAKTLIIIALQ